MSIKCRTRLWVLSLLINCNFIAMGQDWTLVPSESFEFNTPTTPFSNDFIVGFDYGSFPCGIGTYPTLVDGTLSSYNSNNVYYYAATSGEQCARIKLEKVYNYPYAGCSSVSRDWKSGMLYTKSTHNQYGHGKYEIRCKLPKGKGIFPSFWLWNGSPSGEIDIFEIINQQNTSVNYIEFNFHSPDYCWDNITGIGDAENGGGNSTISGDLSNDFHIFSAEWTPEHVIYKIDGKIYWQVIKYDTPYPTTFPPGVSPALMRIITGLTVNNLADANTPTIAYMDIDYIRFYTQDCESHIFCDNDNNNVSYFKGYELQFANPKDINPNAVNSSWNCNTDPITHVPLPPHDFTCPKTITGTGYSAKAENFIIFNPGFTADYGCNFTAEISPCASQMIVHNDNNGGMRSNNNVSSNLTGIISIYPNPNKGSFSLNINKENNISYDPNNQQQQYYNVNVRDILGKEIYSTILNTTISNIELGNLDNGIYFLTVKGDDGQMLGYQKLIIQ